MLAGNRFTRFNPAIGGTYKVSPTLTAYAGYAQNTRTPTASEIECSNPLTLCLLPTNLAGDPPNLKQVIARYARTPSARHSPSCYFSAPRFFCFGNRNALCAGRPGVALVRWGGQVFFELAKWLKL